MFTLTVGERTFELADDNARLVAADALDEAGREEEADILRSTELEFVIEGGVVTRFDGWSVSAGFLDGNLGDEWACSHAREYRDACEEALAERFPGATVRIDHQNAGGSPPSNYRPAVYDADDNERREYHAVVEQIMEDVWQSSGWLPDQTADDSE